MKVTTNIDDMITDDMGDEGVDFDNNDIVPEDDIDGEFGNDEIIPEEDIDGEIGDNEIIPEGDIDDFANDVINADEEPDPAIDEKAVVE